MSERVDVTSKVNIESAQRSGWLLSLQSGARIFVAVGQGYYDEDAKTFHMNKPLAEKWNLL